MKLFNRIFISFLLIISCQISNDSYAQNNSIVIDGAYIVMDGGTATNNVFVVVEQPDPSGIVRLPSGGHIHSENQYNYVKWLSGGNTGNYTFPFGIAGNINDFIPFTFNKTAGNSSISTSTWSTNIQNMPHPGLTNVGPVTKMPGITDSVIHALDRFWDIRALSTTADLTFSYRGIENTTSSPTSLINAQHWNGSNWDPLVGPGTPGVISGVGSAGPFMSQNTFSPWALIIPCKADSVTVDHFICQDSSITVGSNTYSETGVYIDKFTNISDCDSIVTTNLTVIPHATSVDVQTACKSITWIDGNTYTTNNNTATYTLEGQAASGCDSIITLDFKIIPPSTSTDNQTACNSFTWIDGNTYTSDNNTATYTLEGQAASGCDSIITLNLKIVPPSKVTATSNSPICEGETLNLSASDIAGATYQWTGPNGFTSSNQNPVINNVTMLNAGAYKVVATVGNDCADSTTVIVETSEIADIKFSANVLEGCSPLTVNFTDLTEVNGTKEYTWFVDGKKVGQSKNLTYTFDQVKCYDITLQVITDNICTSSHTEKGFICVHPDPIANFTFKPTTIFSDDPIAHFENQSQLNDFNEWDFGGLGQSSDVNPNFTFSLGEENDYKVYLKVTSDKGCVDSTYQIISVKHQTIFYVPNTFTPDGDDVNNIFLPVMTFGVDPEQYNLKVFNRWGELIFESNDLDVGWDGTYRNKLSSEGMYIWKISFRELSSSNIITESGHVLLIR